MKDDSRPPIFEALEGRRLLAVDTSVVPGLTFEAATVFTPDEIGTRSIVASEFVDLDGDGNRDLIYALSTRNGFSVARSTGQGNFDSPSHSSIVRQNILHLHAADLNRDGVTDLIAAGETRIFSLIGKTQDGQWSHFELANNFLAKTNSISVGDVDADGNVDLVLANTQAVVYSGNGDGTFSNPIAYASNEAARRAKLVDLDDDGDLDLVTTDQTGVAVLRNEDGIFETQIDAITEPNNLPFQVADGNGDGVPDLWLSLGSREHAYIGLLPGNGNGTFDKNVQLYDILGQPIDIELADINNDSRIDILVGHSSTFHHPINNNGPGGVSILLANDTGSYHDAIRITTPNASHVYAEDTNGDEMMDIVAVHRDSARVFHQHQSSLLKHESTSFDVQVNSPFGVAPQMAVGDVNGDFYVDHALTSYDSSKEEAQLQLLLGTATGDYETLTMPLPDRAVSVHIGNANDDDDLEVIVHTSNFSVSRFSIFDVDAENRFTPAVETRMTSTWNIVGEMDANGDGIADFIGTVDRRTRLLLGNADGKFTDKPISNISAYQPPPMADFNNDGVTDLLLTESTFFSVLLGSGDGEFAESHRQRFQYSDPRIGDFDGDGNIDVAYTNFDDKMMNIIHGAGNGAFASPQRYERVENSSFYVEDFNGDGRSDFLFDSYQQFTIHLAEGDSFEPIGESFALPVSIRQITALDVDDDGKKEFFLTPGLDFSTPQAQIGILDFNESPTVTTTTFPNTIVSPTQFADVDGDGSVDLLAVAARTGFFTVEFARQPPNGDMNADGVTNIDDVDHLCRQLHQNEQPRFDLVPDGMTDLKDVEYLVEVILGSAIGDVNGDGVFDSSDFVEIFQVNEYEDDIVGNSRWSEGDWNCDGDFTTSDFVYAFRKGEYSAAAQPALRSIDAAGAIADRLFAVDHFHGEDRENWKTKGAIV